MEHTSTNGDIIIIYRQTTNKKAHFFLASFGASGLKIAFVFAASTWLSQQQFYERMQKKKVNNKFWNSNFGWEELGEHGFIQAKDVREKAGLLIDSKFGKYTKFQKWLAPKIKEFFNLTAEGEKGEQRCWVERA